MIQRCHFNSTMHECAVTGIINSAFEGLFLSFLAAGLWPFDHVWQRKVVDVHDTLLSYNQMQLFQEHY